MTAYYAAQENKVRPCQSLSVVYQSEFQGWAAYVEDVKALVEKAFPNLENSAEAAGRDSVHGLARDRSATIVTFAVMQRRTKSQDDAVKVALEMESYAFSETTGKLDVAAVELLLRIEQLESDI